MPEIHFTIADLFEQVADKVPDRDALVCGDDRLSYQQLERRANQLAHYLAAQGVQAGDHIGRYLYNCNEYLAGMLACFKIRAVPINVNYRYVEEELQYIFDNANMVACIYHREFTPHIAHIRAAVPALKTFISVADGSGEDLSMINSVDYNDALQGPTEARDFVERICSSSTPVAPPVCAGARDIVLSQRSLLG